MSQKILGAIAAVLLALAIPLSFLILATRIDSKDRATRCAVVALIDRIAVNSERSAKATLASPASTEQQKKNAVASLAGWRVLKVTTRDALGHPVGAQCPEEP